MHEHSLMADLLQKAEAIAVEHRSRRVRRLTVWLGAMSHISPEHFRHHFLLSSRSTIAEGAELTIETGERLDDPHAQEIILKDVELEQ